MITGYRNDLDGLRAVAVLGVVLFHLGGTGLQGGFVGVDIFFVISGFLVSGVIFNESERGDFSIARFYGRRIRRILPALGLVCLSVSAGAWWLLPPPLLLNYAGSLASAAGFGANIFFYATQNYFSPAADTLPLLHTWSLGIEEQFYILFPLLVRGWRQLRSRRLIGILALLAALSFAASVWLTGKHAAFAFYLLPCRAWELLIGSLLALPGVPAPHSPRVAFAAAVTGLAAIGAAMVFFSPALVFPGVAAAMPCSGAALVIWAGRAAPAPSRLLGAPPLAFIGRISYSLYLWHWPVIVFGQKLFVDHPSPVRGALFFAVSVLLAMISYRFVEQPVRLANFWRRPAATRGLAVASIMIPLGLAFAVSTSGGFPSRYGPHARDLLAFLNFDTVANYREGRCLLRPEQPPEAFDRDACFPADVSGQVLLWGDSTAAALYPGLSRVLQDQLRLAQATSSACPPVPGVTIATRPFCQRFNDLILARVLAARPELVILISAWWIGPDGDALLAVLLHRLQAAGIHAVLVGPPPEYTTQVPMTLANRTLAGERDTRSHDGTLATVLATDRRIGAIAGEAEVPYVSIMESICQSADCPLTTPEGAPLEFDMIHFSLPGSLFVSQRIAPALRRAAITAMPPSK